MRPSSPQPTATLSNGCVVSYCATASAVGARVLRQGGNAMDAAVATSLALAVTYPQAGNLGGGGFLLYKPTGGEAHFLDYRETSPRRLTADLFLHEGARDERRATRGGLPVATPGTVAGLAEALAKHGTWSWRRIVEPAIELARRGVWLTTRQSRYLELYTSVFAEFEPTARTFLPDGKPLLPGELFVQPALAWSLERLAEEGPRTFYEGELGERVVSTVKAYGGVLEMDDLRAYTPVWREPLHRSFLGRAVVAPSLPSGGGIVLLACLGLFEAEGLSSTEPNSAARHAAYGRVMRVAFKLRGALVGDPDRLAPATQARAREIAERGFARGDLAKLERSLAGVETRLGNEQNTTHLCVIDAQGNAVSSTYSLNTIFGAKLVVDGGGFFLNNSIDDFTLAEGASNWYELADGKDNRLEPSKRPVSSMTPTLFLQSTKRTSPVELVIGGSGGPRIPTLIFQVAQATLGDGQRLEESVRQPRVHHQDAPHELAVEDALRPALRYGLLGATRKELGPIVTTPVLGVCAALQVPVGGSLSAVLDSRFTLV